MITSFNTQLFDISMNSATLANTVGANGQISYNYETGKLYVHDGFGGKSANTLVQAVVPVSYSIQGSSYGYSTGGLWDGPGAATNYIQRFSLTSDANAEDVGDLTRPRDLHVSNSSDTNAFTFGYAVGYPNAASQTLESFPFANESSSTDVATGATLPPSPTNALLAARQGSHNSERGYITGGYLGGVSNRHQISYFAYSNYAFSKGIASLVTPVYYASGSSSFTHGYKHGGHFQPTTIIDTIQKFPFSSDANATDVGELIHARSFQGAASSTEYAFVFGGANGPNVNDIQKYAFSSDASAIDTTAGISNAGGGQGGVSGTTSGYSVGGDNQGSSIQKFPYSVSSGTAALAGTLVEGVFRNGGHQV